MWIWTNRSSKSTARSINFTVSPNHSTFKQKNYHFNQVKQSWRALQNSWKINHAFVAQNQGTPGRYRSPYKGLTKRKSRQVDCQKTDRVSKKLWDNIHCQKVIARKDLHAGEIIERCQVKIGSFWKNQSCPDTWSWDFDKAP